MTSPDQPSKPATSNSRHPISNSQPLFSTLRVIAGIVIVAVLAFAGFRFLETTQPETFAAPALVSWEPGTRRDVGPATTFTFHFDRPMQRASVESSLVFSPPVIGTFQWLDDRTVRFTPAAPLQQGTPYSITLGTSSRSAILRPLSQPFQINFTTGGDLKVTSVNPSPGVTEVKPEATITVQFNRPVVPLAAPNPPSNFLHFTPPVTGTGQWLNTSTFVFTPVSLSPAISYTVKIARGFSDGAGHVLPDDYTWQFRTILPGIADHKPGAFERYVNPHTAIHVSFNQPMDKTSVKLHFHLLDPSNQAVAGTVSWLTDTLIFQPDVPLQPGSTYKAKIAAGAINASGSSKMPNDFTWSFTVADIPRLVSSQPADGDLKAQPNGRLVLNFSTPMDQASLLRNLTILPKPTEVYSSWSKESTIVQFYIPFDPSERYTVTLGSGVVDLFGRPLEGKRQIVFQSGPLPPMVSLVSGNYIAGIKVGAISVYTTTRLLASVRNVSDLTLSLYPVSATEVVKSQYNYDYWHNYKPTGPFQGQSKTTAGLKLNKTGVVGFPLTGADGKPLAPGLYFVQVSSKEGPSDRLLLLASRTSVTLKATTEQALVWAIDLQSGAPVAGRAVRLYRSNGQLVGEGKTATDGTALITLPRLVSDPREGKYVGPDLLALVEGDGDFALATTQWNTGIAGWDFGFQVELQPATAVGYLYTDRPIYRPGQTVYYKGIVRADDDGAYSLVAAKALTVTIRDDQGKSIATQVRPVSSFGTIDGELELAEGAGLGYYTIEMEVPGLPYPTSVGFQVIEYRKPEYKVEISSERQDVVQGDTISLTVDAHYFFGAPVTGAAVAWRVYTENYYFYLAGQWYSWADWEDEYYYWRERSEGGRRPIADGRGTTDASGRFQFTVPADLSLYKRSQVFTLEASITDESNQEVSASTQVIVHQGEFYIGTKPSRYVAEAGKAIPFDLLTIQPASRGVESNSPTSQPLTVEFYEHQWHSVRQVSQDGTILWKNVSADTLVESKTVTTGTDGKAQVSFTPPQGGVYKLLAKGRDSQGHVIKSASYIWVPARPGQYVNWRMENNDRVNVIADKREYTPGETAQLLVTVPFEQSRALITTERGKIRSVRVVDVPGSSLTVEVPLTDADAPNVYVSIVLVKGVTPEHPLFEFKVGYADLKVNNPWQTLRIALSSDKGQYQAGDTATYRVRTTDASGKGVPAELSLALVDAAVLSLASDNARPINDAFYARRNLSVQTAQNWTLALERINKTIDETGKGGDGGIEAPGGVRRDFRDTAFWQAALVTDANGNGQVQVRLPDNLTTWRMTARGITQDTRVGEERYEVIATKEVLIRPALPRFVTIGDRVQIAAIVHNNGATTHTLNVDVTATLSGTTGGATPLPFDQGAQANIPIVLGPGHSQRVEWPLSIPKGRSLVLRFVATPVGSSLPTDAVEITLPVKAYAAPTVATTGGEVGANASVTERVTLGPDTDPTLDEVILETVGSLAGGLRDGLEYLAGYPYGCTEQTLSRFLPDVVIAQAGRDLGLLSADFKTQLLPQMVTEGLQRLYKFQRPDGGWGWWSNDEANPNTTFYVLFGLLKAKAAGYAVDQQVLNRGLKWTRDWLNRNPVGLVAASGRSFSNITNLRAFALYVLSEGGQGDVGLTVSLYDDRSKLTTYGKAYLALTLVNLQSLPATPKESRLETVISELISEAKQTANLAYWPEGSKDYWAMTSDVRTTALVLDALVRADANHPLVAKTVRWLMIVRQYGRWGSTYETTWSLLALVDYLVASGELNADYTYTVTANGRPVGQGKVDQGNVTQPQTLVVQAKELLVNAVNELTLKRQAGVGQSGAGRLFYTLYLKHYQTGEAIPPVSDNGLALSREYFPFVGNRPDAIHAAAAGEVVRVKVTLTLAEAMHYLVVEDPLPAGLEAVDTSLRTTSEQYGEPSVRRNQDPWWYGNYWGWQQVELHDDRVAFFATYLSAGTYQYTYLARATTPGVYQVLPASAYQMYAPEVFGRGAGETFTVQP